MKSVLIEAKNLVSELNRLRNKYEQQIKEYTDNDDANEVLRLLNYCDPTSQNGKFGGSYLEWIVRNYIPEKCTCYGDDDELETLRTILSTYESLKSKKQLGKMGLPSDLTKVPFTELADQINDILNSGQFCTADNSTLRRIAEMGDQLKEVYNDGEFAIYAVFTRDANVLLGSCTSWCTANNEQCFKNYGQLFFDILPLDKNGVPLLKSSGRGQCSVSGNLVCIKNIHDKDIYNIEGMFNAGVEHFVYEEMPSLSKQFTSIGEEVRQKMEQSGAEDLNAAFREKYGVELMDAVQELAGFVHKEFKIGDSEPFQNEHFIQWTLKGENGQSKAIRILAKRCVIALVSSNRNMKQFDSMSEIEYLSSVFDEAKQLLVSTAGAAHRKFGNLAVSINVQFDLRGNTIFEMFITGDNNKFFEAALTVETGDVAIRWLNNERMYDRIEAGHLGEFLTNFLSSVLAEQKHGKRKRILGEAKNLDSEINRIWNRYEEDLVDNGDDRRSIMLYNKELDPTSQDGKFGGEYLEWLVKNVMVPNRGYDLDGDTKDAIINMLGLFNSLKEKKQLGKLGLDANIMSYSYDELEKSMSRLKSSGVLKNVLSATKRKIDSIGDQSEKVYDDRQFAIYAIHTHAANAVFGSNTKWCTVGSHTMFDSYGKLYFIVLPIDEHGDERLNSPHRAQFHIQSNGYLCIKDVNDRSINEDDIASLFNRGVDGFIKDLCYEFNYGSNIMLSGLTDRGKLVRQREDIKSESGLTELLHRKFGMNLEDTCEMVREIFKNLGFSETNVVNNSDDLTISFTHDKLEWRNARMCLEKGILKADDTMAPYLYLYGGNSWYLAPKSVDELRNLYDYSCIAKFVSNELINRLSVLIPEKGFLYYYDTLDDKMGLKMSVQFFEKTEKIASFTIKDGVCCNMQLKDMRTFGPASAKDAVNVFQNMIDSFLHDSQED